MPHDISNMSLYYDGELTGTRRCEMEAHLTRCPECAAELVALGALDTLLAQVADAPTVTPADEFVDAVIRKLPDRQTEKYHVPKPRVLWMAAPVIILSGWAFLQAVLLVSAIGTLAIGTFQPLLSTLQVVPPPMLVQLLEKIWQGDNPLVAFCITLLANLVLLILVGVLFWSWLASWQSRRRYQSLGKSVKGDLQWITSA